ncbi:hypothetical protein LINPERPRIM_LOCUS17550 [Linum perenne]
MSEVAKITSLTMGIEPAAGFDCVAEHSMARYSDLIWPAFVLLFLLILTAQTKRDDASGSVRVERCSRWHPPPHGQLKINVDAAVFSSNGRTGAGMCIRDHRGAVCGFRMVHRRGLPPAREVEVWAMFEAIKWAEELGLREVILETDAKEVVDRLQGDEVDDTEFGTCLRQCQ